ncbi:MAG: flagellar export protein FliJ [Calditrichaeota bacterium]|nr:flagellar export protein FliJ [Calditrichota bacterium]
MSRFRFRLQKVLDLRESLVDQAERKLAEARRRESEERQSVAAAEAASDEAMTHLRATVGRTFKAGDAITIARHQGALKECVKAARVRLAEAGEVVSGRHSELVNAARDRSALELLRDRRLTEHRVEETRREQTIIDEAALRTNHSARRIKDLSGI